MTRWATAALALAISSLVFVAVAAAAFTPLSGHYKGKEDGDHGRAISFDFDGAHITHLRFDHHAATAWNAPKYDAGGKSFSAGNSDGGFFVGHWNDATHVSGQHRPLSRANIHKYHVHRVPQPKPGKYHGGDHNHHPVSFTLKDHQVKRFYYAYIHNVTMEQHGPNIAFHGVHGGRNTSIEGHWTDDKHLKGWLKQTGRDRVEWTAKWDAEP